MKSFQFRSALVAAKHSKLRFTTAAFAVLSAALTVPASAQFHIQLQEPQPVQQTQPLQQPQMPTPVAPEGLAETHGWPSMSPDLVALRSSSSPAEKKLSFNLFLITRHNRNALIAPFTSLMDTHPVNADGTVNVEISAYLSPSLMANPVMERVVMVNGGEIPEHAYESDRFQARVTPHQLLVLASNPNVLSIRDINSSPVNASISPLTMPILHRASH